MAISINSMLKGVKLTQWYLKNKANGIGSPSKSFIFVTLDNLNPEDSEKMIRFCKALKLDAKDINNFGLASFANMSFQRYCPAYFCVNPDTGSMGLVIGSSDEKLGMTATFIDCEVKSDSEGYSYFLNGQRIKLKEALNQDGTSKNTAYLELDGGRESYQIPFLINDQYKGEDNIDNVFTRWEEGTFIGVLREFGATGANYSDFNKLFRLLLKENTMPENGIVMILKDGKYEEKDWDDNGKKKKIISSTFKLVGTTHPELIGLIERKVNKTDTEKSRFFLPLSEVTHVQFTTAAQPTTWMQCEGLKTYDKDYALLWVIGVNNTGETDHTPNHVFITDREFFDQLPYHNIKMFAHMIRPGKQLTPGSDDEQETTTIEAAKQDLQPNYPTQPPATTQKKTTGKKAQSQPTAEQLKALENF